MGTTTIGIPALLLGAREVKQALRAVSPHIVMLVKGSELEPDEETALLRCLLLVPNLPRVIEPECWNSARSLNRELGDKDFQLATQEAVKQSQIPPGELVKCFKGLKGGSGIRVARIFTMLVWAAKIFKEENESS